MMPQALAFAATKESQEQLYKILSGRDLRTFATSNAEKAETCLLSCGIVVALLEWSGNPTFDTETKGLLDVLNRAYKSTRTIVFCQKAADREILRSVHFVHPDAWVHYAHLGDTHLAIRLDTAIGRHIGDLSVSDGGVVHLPSGKKLTTNRTALQLVLAAPGEVVVDEATGPMAVVRFRKWLASVNSCVTIENELNTGRYRLVVGEDSKPVAAFQHPYLHVVEAA